MCECYQIGGPFIAEDPDCPLHGTDAQRQREEYDNAMADMRRELDAWRERFPQYVFRPQDDCVALRA